MLSNPWMLVKGGKQVKFRPPFGGMAEMLEYWVEKQPEKTAIEYVDVDGNKNWKCSYEDLRRLVFGAAETLKRRGLKQGDTIAFGYHNHPNILILSLASWISGIRTVPLDLKRDDEEMMKYKLELSGAKMVFREGEEWESNQESPGDARRLLDRRTLDSEALVLFTSGTTAKPKGALLTQENLMANADGIADWLEIKNSDKFMIVLPLHHINSTTMSLATLLRGGTIALVSRYTNSQFFEIAARTGATLSSVVPTIIHDQLANLPTSTANLLKLTRIQLGSAPVVVKETEEFVKMTGIPLIQGYGQTETALRSTGVGWNPKKPLAAEYFRNLRSNTIGGEMKWTNVTVLRGDGKEAKQGEEGEICVRGPVIMKKYLKNPEATKDAFKYGWFHSGDLGYFKTVGGKKQFFIKGRMREIIIKAGVNVSPLAVEEKILKSVAGTDQVYVVGIPDERVGEEIGAVVVWKMISKTSPSTHPVVIKGLSSFETPKYWFSIRTEKLPMTSTGKVQRVKLREMFAGCAAITESDKYLFRMIVPIEEKLIETARQMYNKYWVPLSADKKTWEREIKDKILIGAIDKSKGELAGWIRIKLEGKVMIADAVTSGKSKREVCETLHRTGKFRKLLTRDVENYLKKRIDPVIEWHRRAKAGWKRGAEIVRVVANARPGDRPALGYGVVMEYSPFVKMPPPRLTDSSLGTMLVEAGLVYAYKKGFEKVRALSRPVGLYEYQKLNIKNQKYKLNIKYS